MRLEVNLQADEHPFQGRQAETIISQQIPMDWNQPIRQALWLQNGRLRLYINGERIFDANQIDVAGSAAAEATVLAADAGTDRDSM